MDNNAVFVDNLTNLSEESRKRDTVDTYICGPSLGNELVRRSVVQDQSTFGRSSVGTAGTS